jgi:hypothetical protein
LGALDRGGIQYALEALPPVRLRHGGRPTIPTVGKMWFRSETATTSP